MNTMQATCESAIDRLRADMAKRDVEAAKRDAGNADREAATRWRQTAIMLAGFGVVLAGIGQAATSIIGYVQSDTRGSEPARRRTVTNLSGRLRAGRNALTTRMHAVRSPTGHLHLQNAGGDQEVAGG